ncbi:hypothetical protein KCP77_19465 [Salmonella enterica subsp. enterica]|nr:hypothetical protein KCP77_19465 [Salmonella enterica subsp. enterica]
MALTLSAYPEAARTSAPPSVGTTLLTLFSTHRYGCPSCWYLTRRGYSDIPWRRALPRQPRQSVSTPVWFSMRTPFAPALCQDIGIAQRLAKRKPHHAGPATPPESCQL